MEGLEKGFCESSDCPEINPQIEDKLNKLQPKTDITMDQADEILKDIVAPYIFSKDVPNCGALNDFKGTHQAWHDSGNGAKTYNFPETTGKTLDANQGKVYGYHGTCGLVSVVNNIRLAGGTLTEEDIVPYATKNNLCSERGGTTDIQRKQLLSDLGLQSFLAPPSIEKLAQYVSEGRGVIISVDAGKLWDIPEYNGKGHAVTVTSVRLDLNGNVLGFYVCDSGRGTEDSCSAYYNADKLEAAFTGRKVNVTKNIIR